ncbi:transcriptional regulator [Clostridium polyendosporum]|uniref:Transcriptional regulator n=1 Tax=Clostridium polyendosporum TaxID=69208 RepID=A0A919S0F2_9CLOT|nr:helix-turn-helix domain-containing protein [Clostridium polyendosporum]GIM29134.1 transcriptional regulator [Clostridium polyendosporum]
MIDYNGKKYVCLLDLGFDVIRGKWKAVILCHLGDGAKRFLELQRITCGVSQKVLNEQLRELEDDGLIYKVIYPEVPPRVEYYLTERGKELYPALKMIEEWAGNHYTEYQNETNQD